MSGSNGSGGAGQRTVAAEERIQDLERQLDDSRAGLRDIEERYKSLLEQLPVGVYRTTRRGRIVQGNPALARMLGYSIEELDRLEAEDVFANPHERMSQLEEWQKHGGIISNELLFRRGDGEVIWIRDTGQAVTDGTGKVRYFDGIVEDITKRKHAELALQEERERLDTVLRSIGDGVIAIDLTFFPTSINPPAAQFLDAIQADWKDGPLTSLGGRPIEELLDQPSEEQIVHEIVINEPSRRVFEVTAHAMRHEDAPRGWVLLLREVTRERAIRRGAEAQSRLAAMGQLAAGVAHDFNNVLCGIVANADMLKLAPEISDDARRRLDLICDTCENAAMVIRQIVDFSRLRTAPSRPLDLAHAARAVMTLLRRTLPENLEIDLDALPGTYRVMAEISGIQHVLTNLVFNARDAMPDGGSIRVHLDRRTIRSKSILPFETMEPDGMEPGEWITLEVTDSGSGIADEVLPNIFEPFFSTKGPDKGSGLGLAQAYGIVKQHGGHVDVQTEVGRGSTFTIYFPALNE